MERTQAAGYVVPTYEAPPGAVWYHFLHGNVPGHQIDFMYRPEVPQGPLTRQHFSHLARLVKYIEPREGNVYAFAIGNLSRDDTQYEPGRGGVALIFGLRIRGAQDHAGRQDPPFCHAAVAIDRHLDGAALLEAALAFYHKVLPDHRQADGGGWYHTYVRHAQQPHALRPMLRAYTGGFDDLPSPGPSELGFGFTAEGVTLPKRVVISYARETLFHAIAECASRIAGVLVRSDIRWTAISSGREADVPGGVSIRFVPEGESGLEEVGSLVMPMEEVPAGPKDIAERLFGAREVRISCLPKTRREGWRQQLYGEQAASADAISAPKGPETVWAAEDAGLPAVGIARGRAAEEKETPKSRRSIGAWLGLGAAIGGMFVAVALGGLMGRPTRESEAPAAASDSERSMKPGHDGEPLAPGLPSAVAAPSASSGSNAIAATTASAPLPNAISGALASSSEKRKRVSSGKTQVRKTTSDGIFDLPLPPEKKPQK